jgi:hypothetical protein
LAPCVAASQQIQMLNDASAALALRISTPNHAAYATLLGLPLMKRVLLRRNSADDTAQAAACTFRKRAAAHVS